MPYATKETLCWRCKRPGTNTCSWDASRGTIPVEGWDAEETKLRDKNGYNTTSYMVYDCPLFEEEEDYDYRMTHSYGIVAEEEKKREVTDRERLEYLLRYGWTNKALATEFGLALSTIQSYRQKWLKKQREEERKNENQT